jgi:hypothetical protein
MRPGSRVRPMAAMTVYYHRSLTEVLYPPVDRSRHFWRKLLSYVSVGGLSGRSFFAW